MKFTFREVVFLLLLLAVPVGAYFFVFEPRNSQIAEAREEIRKKQTKLAQLERATRRVEDLGGEIDKLSEALAMFEQKLPAEREIESLVSQIWQIATQYGLRPISISTNDPVKAAQYSELPIEMEIEGDFDGFYKFLLDLETLNRITRMPEMTLQNGLEMGVRRTGTNKLKAGAIRATFTLSVFFDPKSASDQTDEGA